MKHCGWKSQRTGPLRTTAIMLICLTSLIFAGSAGAESNASIEGLWQQFDDKDGALNSLVRIQIRDGKASATIIQGYAKPGKPLDPDQRCTLCPAPFHNQPLVGLEFLWGLEPDGQEWRNGHILDPDNGKIYRAKATLSADGTQLVVRGYMGTALFGRSQTWLRHHQ
jgi:uncharacterized protein (DUF2147 family)